MREMPIPTTLGQGPGRVFPSGEQAFVVEWVLVLFYKDHSS